MLIDLPEALRARGVEKTTYVSPIVRDGSRSPQWNGARRRRQGTISKNFNRTEVVTAATTPRCDIEITCNQVNVLGNHNGTKGLDDFLGNPFFLRTDIADVQR